MPSFLKVMTTHTTFRSGGDTTNDRDRKDNGEVGVARGVTRENQQKNGIVEEVDGIEVGSRKRKRRESVSPLSRLIRSCRGGYNH